MKRVQVISIIIISIIILYGNEVNYGDMRSINPLSRKTGTNLKSLGVDGYGQISSKNIEEIGLNLIDKLIKKENFNSLDLNLSKSYERKGRWMSMFTQYYQGIKIWGSYYDFTIEENGNIIKVGYNL